MSYSSASCCAGIMTRKYVESTEGGYIHFLMDALLDSLFRHEVGEFPPDYFEEVRPYILKGANANIALDSLRKGIINGVLGDDQFHQHIRNDLIFTNADDILNIFRAKLPLWVKANNDFSVPQLESISWFVNNKRTCSSVSSQPMTPALLMKIRNMRTTQSLDFELSTSAFSLFLENLNEIRNCLEEFEAR